MEFAQSTSENEVNAATGPNQRQVWQGQMFMRVEGKTRVLDNVRSDHTVHYCAQHTTSHHPYIDVANPVRTGGGARRRGASRQGCCASCG